MIVATSSAGARTGASNRNHRTTTPSLGGYQTDQNEKIPDQNEPAASSIQPGKGAENSNRDLKQSSNDTNSSTSVSIRELPQVSVTKDWTDRAYWLFSGFLVLVGALQVGLLWKTLGAIRRQAVIMEEQSTSIQAQATTMQQQSAILEKSVRAAESNANAAQANAEAAKAGAETAKENIEIQVNKERARISIQVDDAFKIQTGPLLNEVAYKILIHGTSPAFIIESIATAVVGDSTDIPAGSLEVPMLLPPVVNPTTEGTSKTAFVFPSAQMEKVDVDSINAKRKFVHFYGKVKYRDVFGRERLTKFRYMWTVTDFLRIGSASFYSYWLKAGTEDENSET
jgi:hypothetical protein